MDDNDGNSTPNGKEKELQRQSSSDSLPSTSSGSSTPSESSYTPRMTIAEKEKMLRKEEARLRKLKQQQRNEEEMQKEKDRQAKVAHEYETKRQEDLKKKQDIKEKEDNENVDFYEKEKREREEQMSRLIEGKPVNKSDDDILKGLDAEIAKKLNAKQDVHYEYRACQWIEKMTEENVFDIGESLKSGTILCKLLNSIKPDTIPKYNTRPVALMQRENIKLYLEGCEKLGISKSDLFIISDLHEKKNIPAVVQNIYALARWVHSQPNYMGPVLEGAGTIANTAPIPRHNKERKPIPDFSEPKAKASSINNTQYQSSAPEFKKEPQKEANETKPASAPTTPRMSVNVQELQKEVLALRAQIESLKQEMGKKEHAFDAVTDVMTIEDIMTLLCDKMELNAKEVQQDFQVFHNNRIKNGKHLWMLIKNEKRWNEFKLPVLEKCCLEELMLGYTVTPKPPPSKYSGIKTALWIAAIVGVVAIACTFSYMNPNWSFKQMANRK